MDAPQRRDSEVCFSHTGKTLVHRSGVIWVGDVFGRPATSWDYFFLKLVQLVTPLTAGISVAVV